MFFPRKTSQLLRPGRADHPLSNDNRLVPPGGQPSLELAAEVRMVSRSDEDATLDVKV